MNKKNNIILIGMPGSGKTTLGRKVALLSNMVFFDLDNLIESAEKMSVSDIFKFKGEDYFRECETKTLLSISGQFVLSCGGGTILNKKNVRILSELGTIFYIKVPVDVIYDRIKDDRTRPLLLKENPKLELVKLYDDRKTIYEKSADFIINADKNPDDAAGEIYEKAFSQHRK